jgi:hypothetical protein
MSYVIDMTPYHRTRILNNTQRQKHTYTHTTGVPPEDPPSGGQAARLGVRRGLH